MLTDEYEKNGTSYTCCELWASHSRIGEDEGVTECDVLSQRDYFPVFRRENLQSHCFHSIWYVTYPYTHPGSLNGTATMKVTTAPHWLVIQSAFPPSTFVGIKISDVRGSVHHSIIHKEKSNKMQQYIKFYYSIIIWSSTCFGRHTTHHQEPKTALAASGFSYAEDCLDV